MKEIILKKGYTIKVTSYEGDAFYYKTEQYHTTDKKEVDMLVELLDLTTEWGYEEKPDNWVQQLTDFGVKHKWYFKETRQKLIENKAESVQEILEELVGRYEYYKSEFREQDDYTVYYTNKDIYSEIYSTSRITL